MSPREIIDNTEKKLKAAVEHFESDLRTFRTGRAHPSMLEGVTVEAYGVHMPLNQVATIVAPEAQLLQITPFDPNNLQPIASAIRNNPQLGLNPTDDGRVVRVPVPPLTEERRKQLARQVGERVEECMIAMRTVRHEALRETDQGKKDKSLSEDEAARIEKSVDELVSRYRHEVEDMAKAKEHEIMSV